MPGTIVRALRDAGTRNPVFMIDEIDKMGADFRGDPASAMLEVLDPAQNDSFRDHYLDLPFDLSEVIFIATANILDTIPPAAARPDGGDPARRLHRRREAPHRQALPGRRASSPRTGCKRSQVAFADAALRAIIEEYTREAGVRNLEREIGTVCRKLAREIAEGTGSRAKGKQTVSAKRARELLGRRRVFSETAAPDQGPRRRDRPRLDAGRRRGPVHRGDRDARLGQADDHRPARRRDAGVGAGGALLGARPRPRGSPPTPEDWFADHDIHIHVPGRRRAQGRPLGRRGDGDRARLAGQRQAGLAATSR